MHRPILPVLLIACGSPEPAGPTPQELAAQKCPRVHIDKMAGDWILHNGKPDVRFRILEKGGDTLLWYVDPTYSNHKLELVGQKREKDWLFEERPRGARAKLVATGGEASKRIYVEPKITACAAHVYAGTVDKDGKETVPPKPTEFLEFPQQSGAEFTYAPADEALFLGAAATDYKKAQAELAATGAPSPETEMGDVKVGMWSDANADGDAACTFTFDAYFDDRPVEGGKDLKAGDVKDGKRHWTHTFRAQYLGNHSFEFYRYKTCGDGPKTLISVAGTQAVLN